MTVRLKIIMERSVARLGCCGCVSYGPMEKASFPEQQAHIQSVGKILRSLRERYGERVDVSVVDPRNMIAFWDNIRYGIRPSTPAWILGRKKIFEGVPDLEKLQSALDAELERDSFSPAGGVQAHSG
ncbi:MAG: hypothetical protein LBQ42_05055 [Synergistaceae bacterium]|nr:hypothetical protein [Synergistaceae bacterium]